jgi:DNA invertase Pin-like site-specific DNA recombinase
MLGVFAEFETNLRRERQTDGIKAKERGVYKVRKPSIDAAERCGGCAPRRNSAGGDRAASRRRPCLGLPGAGHAETGG